MQAWILGLSLNLFGSVCFNLSCNLIKLGGTKGELRCRTCKVVQLGWALLIIGSIVNYISFAFASSSLLASLGGVQLLSNLFFSTYVLRERIHLLHLISTALLLTGMTISAVYASHAYKTYTIESLQLLYLHPTFISLESSAVGLVGMALLVLHRDQTLNALKRSTKAALYAFSSATIGTQSVLHSKVLAEMIKVAVVQHDASALVSWFCLAVVLACLTTLIYWLHRLGASLSLFDGLTIIPLMQVFWVLTATVQSSVFFQDFGHGMSKQLICFSTGLGFTLVGVWLLGSIEQRESGNKWDPLSTTDTVWSAIVTEDRAVKPNPIELVSITQGNGENSPSPPSSPCPLEVTEMTPFSPIRRLSISSDKGASKV